MNVNFDEWEKENQQMITHEKIGDEYRMCKHSQKYFDLLTDKHEVMGDPVFSVDEKYRFTYWGIRKET